MRYFSLLVALVLLVAAALPSAAQQTARSALVIGNSNYSFSPLANPANDAQDVANALRKAGFEVDLLMDADLRRMSQAAAQFGQKLKQRGGVGLFFFAGHGVQIGGENYLVPLGDGFADAGAIETGGFSATKLVNTMAAAGNLLNIVILDACRNNPFTGGTNGLTRIESSASLFVSYSTSPGHVASDGDGRNSPYTKHLTLALGSEGLNLEETFKRTLKGVYQETKGQQTPWLSSSFFGDFVFRPGQGQPAREQAPVEALAGGPQVAGVYKVAGTNPNGSRYRGMLVLNEAGNGQYEFIWWIAGQKFRGVGELAGRMMVVDWNSQKPVVYTFEQDGVLDGEWADGSATDVLTPFGVADKQGVPVNGRYSVNGRNPDGSKYRGTLDVDGDGSNYRLKWKLGGTAYEGEGKLVNGLMVIDWGGKEPIIYAVRADGTLAGLWESGKASEIATLQ